MRSVFRVSRSSLQLVVCSGVYTFPSPVLPGSAASLADCSLFAGLNRVHFRFLWDVAGSVLPMGDRGGGGHGDDASKWPPLNGSASLSPLSGWRRHGEVDE